MAGPLSAALCPGPMTCRPMQGTACAAIALLHSTAHHVKHLCGKRTDGETALHRAKPWAKASIVPCMLQVRSMQHLQLDFQCSSERGRQELRYYVHVCFMPAELS